MNGYPPEGRPFRDNGGFQVEPFEGWWARIGLRLFPTVPPDVAHHWIHEHWGHSPYADLRADEFTFTAESWPAAKIEQVLTRWDNFDPQHADSVEKGAELLSGHHLDNLPLAQYMAKHRAWPVRPIVLDNRDGYLADDPESGFPLPSAYILIEGHTRFNIAIHLLRSGTLQPRARLWVMNPAGSTDARRPADR